MPEIEKERLRLRLFSAGDRKREAVKVVDQRGIETLKIVEMQP